MLDNVLGLQKIHTVLVIFKRAYWQYRWQILVTTLLGFISGLLGGLGVGMLIPLFAFITQDNGITTSNTLHQFINKVFSLFHLNYNLPLILGLMISLFVVKAGVVILVNYINEMIASRYVRDTSSMLFKKTLEADWAFIMNQKVGYLDHVIFSDVNRAGGMLINISDIMVRIANLGAYAFVAFNISGPITTASLLGGGLIFAFLKPLFYKTRKLSRYLNIATKEVSHLINESLIGAKTLKSFAVESVVAKKDSVYLEEIQRAHIKASLIGNVQSALFEPVSLLFIAVLFVYFYNSAGFNIASFAIIVYLIQKMYSFTQAIQARLNDINASFTYLDVLIRYRDDVQKFQEKSSGHKRFEFKKNINVQEINFAYPNTKLDTLSNINFTIQKGEMIGLIGPSGAGKTTLVDLFLRLLKPQNGKIAVDDVDIDSIDLTDWRDNIGYVSQDVFLLNDTVEANIRFYDKTISREDVIAASKIAYVYNFIQELPNKFGTEVGERGVKLSGGQRQRIALARVLARKPQLLILDEATSALDNESELLIQEAIDNLKGKITVLVIAHRLSTVMNSDRLIVVENGKLVETGTPEKLIKNSDSYLYKSYHIKDQ